MPFLSVVKIKKDNLMNNKEFISSLASAAGHSPRDTQVLANHLLAELTSLFEDENQFNVQGFGTFEVKKRLERVIVNPGTGQRMLVPPKLTLNFKASPVLKDRMQKGGEV